MLIPIDALLKKYNYQPGAVLHVGANEGQEAKAYMKAGIPEGLFIEALPEVFNKLSHNLAGTPYTAAKACITDRDYDKVTFNVANNGGQSSSVFQFGMPHLTAHPEVKMTRAISLQTIRLDTLLSNVDIVFDFINFDLQGAELLALNSLGKRIKDVNVAYLEINKKSTYVGCALLVEVETFMNKHGLYMVEQSPWIGDTWADSFWVRK